jgi:hypothetical protein
MSTALKRAALRELQNPAPVGQRHAQIVRLACLLRGDGWGTAEIFHRIRGNYDPATLPDAEISNAIKWAENKIPSFGQNWKNPLSAQTEVFGKNSKNITGGKKTSMRSFSEATGSFLNGFLISEADLFEISPVKLPNDFRKDAELTLESLYFEGEKLNIVTRFQEEKPAEKTAKSSPLGFGKTFSREEWLNQFRKNLTPETQAGAWLRINPVNGTGISDEDISEFRFVLLESDYLPFEIQIALFAKLPIPICAILKSGGKSIHAWVRVCAETAGDYRERVSKLFSLLAPFGFDTSNRNPSRLSRLPGAQRIIGALGDGQQRLLYLNPHATERSIA